MCPGQGTNGNRVMTAGSLASDREQGREGGRQSVGRERKRGVGGGEKGDIWENEELLF